MAEKCLYVVSVPIGNLEEITFLAYRILRDIKVIFCEDTRVTRKLLELLKIWNGQDLIKLNGFNEMQSVQTVLHRLKEQDCALVSDAGYPVISDPGSLLIGELRKNNAKIQVVNGPCALVHALVTSGIYSNRFLFASFLTKKYLKRRQELESLRSTLEEATLVYYESKNFLIRGLEILKEVYGDIEIGLCRELSKLNEEYCYGPISKILSELVVKGEFVIIVPKQGKSRDPNTVNMEAILEEIRYKVTTENMKLRQACNHFKSSALDNKTLYRNYIYKYKDK